MPEDSAPAAPDGSGLAPAPDRSNRAITPAVAGALVVLAASFALSVAFVLANGGLNLPAAAHHPSPSGSQAAAIPAATGSPAVSSRPGPSQTPSQTPTSATAAPAATVAPVPTAQPSSNRYALLTACPGTQDCWIYVVRQGDNLSSIANYFGVPLLAIHDRNPWTATTQLLAGQKLRLPPPTR